MRLSSLPRHLPWRQLKYALWLPVYLLCFFGMERTVTGSYWPTQLPVDACIPFRAEFVVFYCLWYPLLAAVGLYLLFRDAPGFRRYMAFLAVTFFTSALVWLLLPNGQDLRPAALPADGFCARWVAGLYAVDTNTNVLPSVHVVGAVGAAWAVWDCQRLRRRRGLRWGVLLLAALICASTLFIKQHTVLDVAAGLLLGLAAGWVLYRRPRRLTTRKGIL